MSFFMYLSWHSITAVLINVPCKVWRFNNNTLYVCILRSSILLLILNPIQVSVISWNASTRQVYFIYTFWPDKCVTQFLHFPRKRYFKVKYDIAHLRIFWNSKTPSSGSYQEYRNVNFQTKSITRECWRLFSHTPSTLHPHKVQHKWRKDNTNMDCVNVLIVSYPLSHLTSSFLTIFYSHQWIFITGKHIFKCFTSIKSLLPIL